MDWGLVLNIALWGFALIGVVAVITVIIIAIAAGGTATSYPMKDDYADISPYVPDYIQRYQEAVKYVREEVSSDIRYTRNPYNPGRDKFERGQAVPTLKGRVDMIEKHLGISVEVKPAQPEKLVIKKDK